MKKWILVLIGLLLVAALLIDVIIPSTLTISRIEPLRCRAAAVWPWVSDEAKWGAWWPDSAARTNFHIQRLSYHVVHIGIHHEEKELPSQLSLLPVGTQDSTLLQWETQLQCSWNPLDRVRQYRRAAELKKVMDGALTQAGHFSEKKSNLYGVDIRIGTLPDTLLIATRTVTTGKPTNEQIYAQIGKLSKYLSDMHARPTNAPMANIAADEGHPGAYKLMTAIPIDTRLDGNGEFFFSRLIPWRYLVGEVKGGPGAVDKAFKRMDTFILDYQITVMAVPFQLLVTDRMQEKDSSRWVTRIYYPIF